MTRSHGTASTSCVSHSRASPAWSGRQAIAGLDDEVDFFTGMRSPEQDLGAQAFLA
jgi:hypothetical protein